LLGCISTEKLIIKLRIILIESKIVNVMGDRGKRCFNSSLPCLNSLTLAFHPLNLRLSKFSGDYPRERSTSRRYNQRQPSLKMTFSLLCLSRDENSVTSMVLLL